MTHDSPLSGTSFPHIIAEHVEQLLETFREGVCISDTNGVIVHVNKSYEYITGIPQEEMLHMQVEALVARGILDTVLNPEVMRTKRPATTIQHVSNGKKLMLEASPVFDKDGELILCFTLIRDVTLLSDMREQLSAQKELLEALQQISGTPEGREYATAKRVIAESPAMRKLHRDAAGFADFDATVLILGETGVGKEVAAKRIHSLSHRKNKPFIKVDCGSIPENLIETELFGYVPGTFSGGNKNGKIGLFEAADGGTLFLDELAELPLHMQTRLLRFLQDREIMRVGSTKPKNVNVRIIAATNRDLARAAETGEFRSDLYYRINVAVLTVPPLRQRKADIIPLALMFLDYYCEKFKRKLTFTDDALESLTGYKWPGNVRELENLIQRAVLTCQRPVLTCRELNISTHCPNSTDSADPLVTLEMDGRNYADVLAQLEERLLRSALARYGSITEVARNFKVARSTIFRKVKRFKDITE